MKRTICAALLSACALSGCGTTSNLLLGVPPSLQQSNLVADEASQEMMIESLQRKAALPAGTRLGPNDLNWGLVAEAGLVEVDVQCDRYLAALFAFNREQRAGRQILTAAGAGTAAIMGITGAPGMSIAVVATAFGMAASIFDAGVNSVLFTMSPVAVRAVAARGRQAYIAGIKTKEITTRPRMMAVVQGYLSQCTPAAIEANIDNAATGAPSVSGTPDTALKAAALASPSASIVQDPRVFITTPVQGPSARQPDPRPGDAPLNLAPTERVFITSKQAVKEVQRALGADEDGDLGPAGVLPRGETRAAIVEFRLGAMRRAKGTAMTASDVLDERTFQGLKAMGVAGPMPKCAKSAFERGLLCNIATGYKEPDIDGYGMAIETLTGAPAKSETFEKLNEELRAIIKAKRKVKPSKDPQLPGDALDSDLFDHPPK